MYIRFFVSIDNYSIGPMEQLIEYENQVCTLMSISFCDMTFQSSKQTYFREHEIMCFYILWYFIIYFITQLGREREERNYYQLERDRLSTFWDVATKQLDESRAECRVKDRELEETEERHQMEVKIYKQKVKHLLYEQENHLAGLKAENMVSYIFI